jgi:hypothetical protein
MTETVDQRVALAREYLASIRIRPVATLPPLVLERECAELRRQLGQVLAVFDDHTDQETLTSALADAIAYCQDNDYCAECATAPDGCCESHADRLARAAVYRRWLDRIEEDR